MTTEISAIPEAKTGQIQFPSIYSPGNFESFMEMAKQLASSDLVPIEYRGPKGASNCMIALELAQRMKVSPFMVMQNLDIINGKPGWSSKFLIAAIKTSGRLGTLKYEIKDIGKKSVDYTYWSGPAGDKTKKTIPVQIHDFKCRAYTEDLSSNETIFGPWVSIEMAVKEGWYNKSGSKWPTMPDTMIRYRAASFFSRLHVPEIGLGMHTTDELSDGFTDHDVDSSDQSSVVVKLNKTVAKPPRKKKEEIEEPEIVQPEIEPVDDGDELI